MVEGRCMVTANGGPMGRLRIEVPESWSGRPAHGGGVAAPRFACFRRPVGPWDVVGLDRCGVERYRVTGYGSEDEARATLEFHPRGSVLAYEVRFAGPSRAG